MFEVTKCYLKRKRWSTILRDQNDINESTRAQLEAINDALTELQNLDNKKLPLPEIGYAAIQKRIDEEKKKK